MTVLPAFLIFLSLFSFSYGIYELCNPGKSKTVYSISKSSCPGGVLFVAPLTFSCLTGTADTDNWIENVCTNTAYDSNKVQFMTLDDEPLEDGQTCKGTDDPDLCDVETVVKLSSSNLMPPEIEDDDDIVDPNDPIFVTNDEAVNSQTKRVFENILGITEEIDIDGSPLRIVDLLKQSFVILSQYCTTAENKNFVPEKFVNAIEKAFLFVVREADLSVVKDVTVEEFERIKKALDACSIIPNPLALNGTQCLLRSKIKYAKNPISGEVVKFRRNELSYQYGKYDLITDAAFGATDFVHGLCFGQFKDHINSHHLYQQAMERLFTEEMVYRWSRPTKLALEHFWDSMFSASVNNTMKNLDACIQASYLDTPFLHRLERILVEQKLRKRRSAPAPTTLEALGLDGAGWCFQSEAEKQATLEVYMNKTCT